MSSYIFLFILCVLLFRNYSKQPWIQDSGFYITANVFYEKTREHQ
jgi:hypothetical protein